MNSKASQWPKISVILGNFNYEQWVERAVLSVVEQDYPNLEFLVIDDGSTDRSIEILNKYKASFDYWNPRENKGHFSWVQEGCERATGDLINWLCSDDYLAPEALWKVGQQFKEKPCDLITGEAIRWTGTTPQRLKPQVPARFSEIFSKGLVLPQPATFIRTALFRQALPPKGMVDVLVDTALYLKLWAQLDSQITFQIIPNTLAHVENHPNAQTSRKGLITKAEILRIYNWLEEGCQGKNRELTRKRKRLHARLDKLETIAASSQEGLSKLIHLLLHEPRIIIERSFWGAVRKKIV